MGAFLEGFALMLGLAERMRKGRWKEAYIRYGYHGWIYSSNRRGGEYTCTSTLWWYLTRQCGRSFPIGIGANTLEAVARPAALSASR